MMSLTFGLVVLVVILGWLILRQPPDELVRRYRLTIVLQWIGLIILVGFAGFWGWFGIAEMGSDPSGVIHLLLALPIAFLVYLGWRRPGAVGWGLVLIGLLITLAIGNLILILGGPLLASGLALIAAARLARSFFSHDSRGSVNRGGPAAHTGAP